MNSCLPFTSSFRPPSLLLHRMFNGSVISSSTSFCLSRLRSSSRSRSIISFQHVEMASSASQPSKSVATGDAIGASDVFHMIQSYQAEAARLPPIEEVRTILDGSVRGILSTHSQDHVGYPSGSMVDFACFDDGSPLLAISSLAVHSKNLLANPRCSLLVAKDPEDRTDIVITLMGDAVVVSENDRESVRTAYLRRHPNAFWVDFGDFCFFQINPKFVRYVTGVATASLGSGGMHMGSNFLLRTFIKKV
ncbi:hypothetical protein HPP92_018470 [Vanilla planifolia]|uniref:CREG-like beta-barrel domain-containing protein n=1 Tax=Vanilla planifolia TaxID=51239 RepID=A0A835Q9V4_VANPL|nr:hypothetical protein HPP92_018470 [Vanilla planifolia]